MKNVIVVLIALGLWACANDSKTDRQETVQTATPPAPPQAPPSAPSSADAPPEQPRQPASTVQEKEEAIKNLKPNAHNTGKEPILIKGVNLTYPVRRSMAASGRKVYEKQGCNTCHSLGSDKLKAKGFGGITKSRKPEWIINMTTGVATSLEASAAAQAQLEKCPVRKADARLNIMQARDFLEFLRMNDGEKTD